MSIVKKQIIVQTPTSSRTYNAQEFYNKLLELYNQYENVILEGSSINPNDINIFNYDSAVLLYKSDITPEKMLELSRKYDNDWTTRREDEYLLELFKNYINYSNKWVQENLDIAIDTSNLEEGVEIAKERLYSSIKNKRMNSPLNDRAYISSLPTIFMVWYM